MNADALFESYLTSSSSISSTLGLNPDYRQMEAIEDVQEMLMEMCYRLVATYLPSLDPDANSFMW